MGGMRFRLRTLLLLALVLPPAIGALWPIGLLYRNYLVRSPPPIVLQKTDASSAEYIWRDADGKSHVGYTND